jgi:hypothetical protein
MLTTFYILHHVSQTTITEYSLQSFLLSAQQRPQPIPTICLKMTQTEDEECQKINAPFKQEQQEHDTSLYVC